MSRPVTRPATITHSNRITATAPKHASPAAPATLTVTSGRPGSIHAKQCRIPRAPLDSPMHSRHPETGLAPHRYPAYQTTTRRAAKTVTATIFFAGLCFLTADPPGRRYSDDQIKQRHQTPSRPARRQTPDANKRQPQAHIPILHQLAHKQIWAMSYTGLVFARLYKEGGAPSLKSARNEKAIF